MNNQKTLRPDVFLQKRISFYCLRSLAMLLIACSSFFLFFCKEKHTVRKDPNLNVLLITIDTLRADRVGYSGYPIETPNLDFLADKGACFMNAVCQVPLTLPSHASIFTGTNPPFHQVKNNGTYYVKGNLTTLAEILKEKAYTTAAFIGAFPLHSQFGLNQGFDLYDDHFKNPEYLKGYEPQRIAEEVHQRAAQWLRRNGQRKFFVWVHYYDPHLPYTPPPPFDKDSASPYEGEIAYTDVYVGKLLDLLKEKEVYKNTLIIIVGDHGEGLGDHREDTHGIFLYDTTLKVPLIFHCPDVIPEGTAIQSQVRTIDIFPSILEILKISVPEYCQGKSLVSLMEGRPIEMDSYAETYLPLLACGWSELKALRTNKWKFIRAPHPELYDLENDPLERDNLAEKEKDRLDQWQKKLEAVEKKISVHEDPQPIRRLTPEEKEKLAALGYIGESGSGKTVRTSNIDPKDKIHIFEETQKAEMALSRGELERAEEILKKLVAQEPENPMIHHSLGKAFQKLEEWEKSIEEFKMALGINGDDYYSHYALAVSYHQTGREKEAIQEARIVLSYLGKHLNSLLLLADIYGTAGAYKEGAGFLHKALEIEPENVRLRLLYADYLTLAGAYDEAFTEYKYISEKIPDDPEVYHGWGMLSYMKEDYESAIQYFSKEIELRQNPESYFLLGVAYGKLANNREAIRYLEKYLNSLPPDKIEERKKAESALLFFKARAS
ncbi:MAG: sulfatase-like hydrolase/transferase [Candidatus Aminicenantales bacterium]